MRKHLAKPSLRLIRALMGMEAKKISPLPPRVRQTIEERETDTVFEVFVKRLMNILVHWEYQVHNDPKMIVRMAIYDFMLYEETGLEVKSVIIYIGKVRLRMNNKITFFGASYTCPIIDIRTVDPEIFLQSVDTKEVILGILTGSDDVEEKLKIIRRIVIKLQEKHNDSPILLSQRLYEMECLAQVRGTYIQQLIKKEVSKMWMIKGLDKRKSLFYQEALHEANLKNAESMLIYGIPSDLVRKITNLSLKDVKELKKRITQSA